MAAEPRILARLQPAGAAEMLDILAKACFLPNRVRKVLFQLAYKTLAYASLRNRNNGRTSAR